MRNIFEGKKNEQKLNIQCFHLFNFYSNSKPSEVRWIYFLLSSHFMAFVSFNGLF